ncbi:Hypothetical predicted protein, partial [Olea europaea subsp. europaea]
QILKPRELPETILPVPRARMPVQLLGREDACLVKVFCCGDACEEFDKDSNGTRDYLDSAEDLLTSVASIEGPHHVVLSSGTC